MHTAYKTLLIYTFFFTTKSFFAFICQSIKYTKENLQKIYERQHTKRTPKKQEALHKKVKIIYTSNCIKIVKKENE